MKPIYVTPIQYYTVISPYFTQRTYIFFKLGGYMIWTTGIIDLIVRFGDMSACWFTQTILWGQVQLLPAALHSLIRLTPKPIM